MMNKIYAYVDEYGYSPYEEWLAALRCASSVAAILSRVDRMELGLFGDVQSVGEGISELRIHYGPGYRVYFGKEREKIYVLLCGGDKSTQERDIKWAKAYWLRCKRGSKHEKQKH